MSVGQRGYRLMRNAGAPTSPDDEPAELAFYCPECAEGEFGD
jgi:hypothetical protein